MSAEERQLLEAAKGGDLEAFAALVRHFERRVRGVLFRLLDDVRDVDEAAQDTFVKAWRGLPRFRGEAAPFTWLYRIAVNEALMRRRASTRWSSTRAVPPPRRCRKRSSCVPPWSRKIRTLPIEQRAALVLRDVEGLSNQEVAAVLELSLAAAKSRIHRARMALREALVRRGALD